MYTSLQGVDVAIFYLPARLLISDFTGSGKSFFISRLLRRYTTYIDQTIAISSSLENSENLQIKQDDAFNPSINDFEG